MSPLRVLLVEDDPIIRRAMRRLLAIDFDDLELTEAGTVAEALARVDEEPFDLVLLDLGLPDGSGLDAIAPMRVRQPGLPILVVSSQPESQYAEPCRRAGAVDFLAKDQVPESLARLIRRIRGL